MDFHIRPARSDPADIAFILSANREIEGGKASLTEESLMRDIFCAAPKAYVAIAEAEGRAAGLVFYSLTYWASSGQVMWISQMYVLPAFRGRFIYRIKRWLEREAQRLQAPLMVWATEKSAPRSLALWKAAGATELNDNYSFWYKKTGA